MLSVRFEVAVSLLLAPARADKRDPKASFPLMENAGIQPAIRKRLPARAPAGAESTACYTVQFKMLLLCTVIVQEQKDTQPLPVIHFF